MRDKIITRDMMGHEEGVVIGIHHDCRPTVKLIGMALLQLTTTTNMP